MDETFNTNKKVQLKHYDDYLPFGDVINQEKYYSLAVNKVQDIFLKSNSKTLERYIKDIKIVKVENKPITFGRIQTQYEKRELYETCTPSDYSSASSQTKHFESEYDVWHIAMPEASEGFIEQENVKRVEGSDYIEGCATCGTTGRVDCYRCYDGHETCPTCNGSGNFDCPDCGGRGIVRCSNCGGAGYTIHTETVYERDNDGHEWAKYIEFM